MSRSAVSAEHLPIAAPSVRNLRVGQLALHAVQRCQNWALSSKAPLHSIGIVHGAGHCFNAVP